MLCRFCLGLKPAQLIAKNPQSTFTRGGREINSNFRLQSPLNRYSSTAANISVRASGFEKLPSGHRNCSESPQSALFDILDVPVLIVSS
jgi:hypothetical protein